MIRKLQPIHREAFKQLRRESLDSHPGIFGSTPDQDFTDQQITNILDPRNETDFVLGYFEEEKLCGILGFARPSKTKRAHKGHLWGFYVKPEHLSRGTGRLLLDEIIHIVKSDPSIEILLLTVTNRSEPAYKLYEEAGFTTYGVEKKALKLPDGIYLNEVLMRLELD